MRRLIFGALLASGAIVNANAQQCPIGSYLWVDNWGNQICKGFGTGQTTTIQGDLETCPSSNLLLPHGPARRMAA
jgi:hypothetical protein